ncbi:MAG: ATP-dependent helicase, partial [Acidimicrobiia bacterium]
METQWRVGPSEWGEAIASVDGPQLIVAGPGTGKTEFLVRRARHLIESGQAAPAEVLILTFSRRAAGEIARRTTSPGRDAIASRTATSPVVTTFHSFAHRLLEAHGPEFYGWQRTPTLLTGPEQVALVSELLSNEDPQAWPILYRSLLFSPTLSDEVADFLLRCQERLLSPGDIKERSMHHPQWRALPDFMKRYARELEARERIDYGGLLAMAAALLDQPRIAESIARQHRYILVDEYQDTSPAQVRLLERATLSHRNLTVSGDPYQSVYSFRGAELANVSDFCERFRGLDGTPARRLILTTSFRVPAAILAGALRVVATGDLPGAAGSVTPADHPGRVEAYVFDQASAEAEWISGQIERMRVEENLKFAHIGVFSRSSRHFLPELSRALERRRIPHNTPDRRLVDHPAVRVIFDLVEAAQLEAPNTPNVDMSLLVEQSDRVMRRLLLGPLFAMSLSAERALLRRRRRTGHSWREILIN